MKHSEKNSGLWKKIAGRIRQILRKKEKPPEGDPYAYVGAPLRRGPNSRSGAAVAEIEDDSFRDYRRQH